ncbi:MAG: hypothetical protein EON61_09230 [Alphaproteobacteria bacterium]|nr:MAG: hypothetical protein EON61_09230 [Alphaproteobacteria bacterium]
MRSILAKAALMLAVAIPAAHAQTAGEGIPRGPGGKPDLQGVWTNASLSSLERNAQLPLVLSETQAKALEARRAAAAAVGARPTDPNAPAPKAGQDVGAYNQFWMDPGSQYGRIRGEARSSWIVDPADGRIPYTPDGRKLLDAELHKVRNTFTDPEARLVSERCLVGFGSTGGPPMINVIYNNMYQIVQTDDHVVVMVEMNHDARIIPLAAEAGERPPQWLGASQGRWEGDTLVVETTGFRDEESLRPYFTSNFYVSPDAKVIEKFTRWSDDQIIYEFTVEDPKVYKQPWRAEMVMNKAGSAMFEYACHEGNYSLPGILQGARRDERLGIKTAPVDVSE